MRTAEVARGWDVPMRWLLVRNDSGVVVPAFGVMRITGVALTSDDSTPLFTISQPNTDGQPGVLINGPCPIAVGKTGQAHLTFPAVAAYDQSGGAEPAVGERWGPKSGSWHLTKNLAGFWIAGGGANGLVNVVPVGLSSTTPPLVGCLLYLDADGPTVASNSSSFIAWDTIVYDTGGFTSGGGPWTTINFPSDGVYQIELDFAWYTEPFAGTVLPAGGYPYDSLQGYTEAGVTGIAIPSPVRDSRSIASATGSVGIGVNWTISDTIYGLLNTHTVVCHARRTNISDYIKVFAAQKNILTDSGTPGISFKVLGSTSTSANVSGSPFFPITLKITRQGDY